MSYLVLARKYRPQTFAEIVGQIHVTRPLKNAIERGKVHHAFLLCGTRGTGKTTTARILAKALSCMSPQGVEPCNMCASCADVTGGASPDIIEIDAASQNSVEDIRKIRETVRFAPVRGKRKMYILDEVHMLSAAAFNAALKMLEEPPAHALFVFATTDPHKLPQTILTRVQRYDFKLVPTATLAEHLAEILTHEQIPYEWDAIVSIAREGGGSVRDSLSLLDQVLVALAPGDQLTCTHVASMIGAADRSLIIALANAMLQQNNKEILDLIQQAYDRGYDMILLTKSILSLIRDMIVLLCLPAHQTDHVDVTQEEAQGLRSMAKSAKIKPTDAFAQLSLLIESVAHAPVPRHALEMGLVRV